jgi:D-alanine transaminase
VIATARGQDPTRAAKLATIGVAVIAVMDIRWGRCDIKSVSLLPNVLAKQQAREAGAFEAWLVDGEGYVTEGSSTNAWIVDGEGNLVTRYIDNAILAGVTRRVLVELAARERLRLIERKFTVREAQQAREAFLTSTTSEVMPVISIDGQSVGDGKPGPLATRLRALCQAAAVATN